MDRIRISFDIAMAHNCYVFNESVIDNRVRGNLAFFRSDDEFADVRIGRNVNIVVGASACTDYNA